MSNTTDDPTGTTATAHLPDWSTLLRPVDDQSASMQGICGSSLLFGRSLKADVVLQDRAASREHARLTATAQGVLIEDLQSAAGTRVNGIRVDRLLLQAGDIVQIGAQQWAWRQADGDPTRPDLATDMTLRHVDHQTGLESIRLTALIDGCARLDQAHSLDQIAQTVAMLARTGSGYQQARWFDATANGYACRFSNPSTASAHAVSQTLLRAATPGQVLQLGPEQLSDYSQSLHQQNLQATLAIAIEPDASHRAVLVIDRRDADSTARDVPDFCRALASVARLAWSGLLHKRAVLDERQRLHDQLHDDLGARLLDQVYQAETPEQADRARNLLNDLRDLVSHPVDEPTFLLDVLADVGAELNERAERAGIRVLVDEATGQDHILPTDTSLIIRRSLRELTTNALKHAQPTALALSMQIDALTLQLRLTQSARTEPPEQWSRGHGLSSLTQRLKRIGGDLCIEHTDDQTCFVVTVPLGSITEEQAS